MFQIDIISLIPRSLRQKLVEITINALLKSRQGMLDLSRLGQLSQLLSDESFAIAYEQALQRGANHFVSVYLDEDEDLVEAIADDERFFDHAEVEEAFLTMLQKPRFYLAAAGEQGVLAQSFDTVFRSRRNRKRVKRAVTFFLRYLVKEVWNLPALGAADEARQDLPDYSGQIGPSHNLPKPDYERFVGRKAARQKMRHLLSPTHRSWVLDLDMTLTHY